MNYHLQACPAYLRNLQNQGQPRERMRRNHMSRNPFMFTEEDEED